MRSSSAGSRASETETGPAVVAPAPARRLSLLASSLLLVAWLALLAWIAWQRS